MAIRDGPSSGETMDHGDGVAYASPGHIVVQGKGVSCTLNSIQYETMLIKVGKIRKRLEKD